MRFMRFSWTCGRWTWMQATGSTRQHTQNPRMCYVNCIWSAYLSIFAFHAGSVVWDRVNLCAWVHRCGFRQLYKIHYGCMLHVDDQISVIAHWFISQFQDLQWFHRSPLTPQTPLGSYLFDSFTFRCSRHSLLSSLYSHFRSQTYPITKLTSWLANIFSAASKSNPLAIYQTGPPTQRKTVNQFRKLPKHWHLNTDHCGRSQYAA